MKRYFFFVLVLLLLAACGAEPTPTPDAVATQIAVEKAAHATMTAEAPTATNTPEPTHTAKPTDTPAPTATLPDTPAPTASPTATYTPVATYTPRPTPTARTWSRFESEENDFAFEYPAGLEVESTAERGWRIYDEQESKLVIIGVMEDPPGDWKTMSLEDTAVTMLALYNIQLAVPDEDVTVTSKGEVNDYDMPAYSVRAKVAPGMMGIEMLILRSPDRVWAFYFASANGAIDGWLEWLKDSLTVGTLAMPKPSPTEAATEPPQATEPPTPTNTPESAASPAPQPTTSGPVALRGMTDHISSIGSFHVMGEVVNNTDSNLEFVKIVGSFYDAGGELVDTDYTYTMLDIVEAGDTAPFDLSLFEPPTEIDSYELQVEYDTTDETPIQVEILSQQDSISIIGSYEIVGEVQNPHDFALEYVQIVGTCYDADGNVVGTDFTYTQLDILGPGQKSPFELSILDPPDSLDHCRLQTQASRQ